MSVFSDSENLQMARILAIANTSISFFRWLERNSAVRKAADDMPEEDLIENIRALSITDNKTEFHIAEAYASLVALILKRRRVGTLGPLPAEAKGFEWSSEIWDFANRRVIPTSILAINTALPTPAIKEVGTAISPYKALSNTQSILIKG